MRQTKSMKYALVLSALLQGCTANVVRETADELSTNVTELNQGLTTWQGVMGKDADERTSRIAGQRVRLATLENDLKRRMAVWKLADRKQAILLHEGIQEVVASGLEAVKDLEHRLSRERTNLKATQEKYSDQQKMLASLARQLRAMSEEPDSKDQIKFVLAFAKATNDALADLEKQIEKDSE